MSDHSLQARLLVSDVEAAAMLAIGRSTFWARVKDGSLPAPIKLGGALRWRVADLENAGPVDRPIERRPRSVPLGPDVQHLYRHFDKEGRLLYVGVSLSAIARLADHKKESHWFWQIARIEVTAYRTRAAVLKAERISIKREKPLHNIVHAERDVP